MSHTATEIYSGGTILTMDGADRQVEAVAVYGDRILAAGTLEEAAAFRGPDTRMIDLSGRTMLPGFYDPHSHVLYYAWFSNAVDLSPTAERPVHTIDDCIGILRSQLDRQKDGWLNGWNCYDLQDEKGVLRFPNRSDLDLVSKDLCIVLQHESFHKCSMNSRALEAYGIQSDTPDPPGGTIERIPGTREPNGVLYEACARQALLGPVAKSLCISPETIAQATAHYASKGITTANEGVADLDKIPAVLEAERLGLLHTRMTLTPRLLDEQIPFADYVAQVCQARDTLRRESQNVQITAVKLMYDGSIQLGTAYLSQPYHCDPTNRGYPECTTETLLERVRTIHASGMTAQIHCIGDAAISDILDAYATVQAELPRLDPRHILIHALMISEDDLRRAKSLGVIPALYPPHIYYYGDQHRDKYLGPERAARISPLGTAQRLGLPFTIHDDAPSFPIDPLLTVHCAVNRLTASEQVLGAEERITPLEALKAITIRGAYQYHEETVTGSIEVGKRADLVILEENPLTCDPTHIKDIRIYQTILGGQTAYLAD